MDAAYEASVLNYLLGQPRLVRAFGRALRDYHFESIPLRLLASIIFESAQQHGAPPNEAECHHLIHNISARHEWPQAQTESVQRAIGMVWQAPATGVSGETVKRFLLEREARAIGAELSTLAPADLIKKASDLRARWDALHADHTSEALTLGRNVFGDGPDGLEYSVERVGALYDPALTLPTGLGSLMDHAFCGGFRRKEITVIMAFTGVGKTSLLLAIAEAFNRAGLRVVYYAIDNTEDEMLERVTANQSGIPIDYAREISARKKDLLYHAPKHDLFVLREWSPLKHRMSDVRAHLEVVRAELGEVAVVLIDSPQLMVPENGFSREAKRHDHASVYYEFLSVVKDENLVGIGTHQTNRAGDRAPALSLDMTGEALAIVQPAANVIGISQTMAEKVYRTYRAQLLKLRRPEGVGKQQRFFEDRHRQRIWPDPDQTELMPMYDESGNPTHPLTGVPDAPALPEAKERPSGKRGGSAFISRKPEVEDVPEADGWASIRDAVGSPEPVLTAANGAPPPGRRRGVGNPQG